MIPDRQTNVFTMPYTLMYFYCLNRFRRVCHYIVNLRHFDNFMLVVIIVSSILLAVEDPVDDYSRRNKVNGI